MKDRGKTKEQLIRELKDLRQSFAESERTETKCERTKGEMRESRDILKTLAKNANEGTFQLSRSRSIRHVNPKAEEILGCKPEDFIERHFKKATTKKEASKSLEALKRVFSGKIIKQFVLNKKDNKWKIASKENKATSTEKEGRIVGVRRVKRDIRENNQVEEELRNIAAKNKSLIIAVPDLMFRLDKNGIFLGFIPEKESSLEKLSIGFLGKSVNDVLDKEIAKKFIQCVKQAVKTGETQTLEYQLSLNGKDYHYETRIAAIGNEEALVVVRDFTRQKQAESMAVTDPLTNAYNRRKFSEVLDQEIKRVERYDRSFSIVLLDIDNFKKINDMHGHDVGDFVLKRVTELVRENIRDVDILSRYGGEEFVIILPETSIKGAMVVAERIRKVIESACFDKVGHITVSAGVSDFMQGDNSESVFKKADNALYIAKNEGRNRVSVH